MARRATDAKTTSPEKPEGQNKDVAESWKTAGLKNQGSAGPGDHRTGEARAPGTGAMQDQDPRDQRTRGQATPIKRTASRQAFNTKPLALSCKSSNNARTIPSVKDRREIHRKHDLWSLGFRGQDLWHCVVIVPGVQMNTEVSSVDSVDTGASTPRSCRHRSYSGRSAFLPTAHSFACFTSIYVSTSR